MFDKGDGPYCLGTVSEVTTKFSQFGEEVYHGKREVSLGVGAHKINNLPSLHLCTRTVSRSSG